MLSLSFQCGSHQEDKKRLINAVTTIEHRNTTIIPLISDIAIATTNIVKLIAFFVCSWTNIINSNYDNNSIDNFVGL